MDFLLSIRVPRSYACVLLIITCGWTSDWSTQPLLADDHRLQFNRDIRPILSDKCFSCHGLDKNARQAGLRLDQRDAAIEKRAIVPGHADQSSLIERIFSDDHDLIMPPDKSNKPLTAAEKERIRKWIDAGAEYEPHWSFIPVPKTVTIPGSAKNNAWTRNPIDAFVLKQLEERSIEPAAETTREQWFRRASLDLTGLPPALPELDLFLADSSPDAYENAVDRLLNSTAYGERMALQWLDAARYADTFGYQADRDTHVWPWRDWVIKAFNDNLSYDQFITWQTAGDLLPNPTREQRLATAFNRLHRQTNEGGSIEEEFRQSYIADRVVTNGTAFLGLTLECARCHNHKFDPITQAEFYKFAAFFANIDEHGLYSHFTETAPTPAMLLFEGDQEKKHQTIVEGIHAAEKSLAVARAEARKRYESNPLAQTSIDSTEKLEQIVAPTKIEPKLVQPFEEAKVTGENHLVPGVIGEAIQFGGDDAFSCAGSGQYGRTTPMTISLWLKATEQKPRVVVLHQCVAAEDAAYRGYSLVLNEGHLQFSLIHFWPGNAIQIESIPTLPLNQWTHVAIAYDGSSNAEGLRILLNGTKLPVNVIRNKLTRDITYRKEWGDSNGNGVEMSLGARFRDIGFRNGSIDELQVFDRELSDLEIVSIASKQAAVQPTIQNPLPQFSDSQKFEHYLLRMDDSYRTASQELHALRVEENDLVGQVRQLMVMQELEQPRPTHVLKRGAYDAPDELVSANTPESLHPLPTGRIPNRLDLANWMIDDRNPLPSRVAVNRFWSLFFGRGLVETLEDFGGQGQVPTHPELLDWLARDFMDHGWNVKRLCKQILLSSTYRQSSIPRSESLMVDDPDNHLLGRGPRYRLPAELIRDQALTASGLLKPTVGGPSVMPYQPAGLWEESGTNKSYNQSKGDGLYRRSLYTFWRRTSPPPNMITFDATGREVCTARRERTSTPLQALVLLNDPQYVEAARVLASKLLQKSENNLQQGLTILFRELTSRMPTARELAVLQRLFQDQKSQFDAAPDEAIALISIGESPRPADLNPSELAAMTIVASTVMSFDECVTKR